VATPRRVHEGRSAAHRLRRFGAAVDRSGRGGALPARPDVEVDLRERSTVDQLRALRAGEIDIGLAPLPIDDGLDATVATRASVNRRAGRGARQGGVGGRR
jgi:hypothetical protein